MAWLETQKRKQTEASIADEAANDAGDDARGD
jgi:hypothetical protein